MGQKPVLTIDLRRINAVGRRIVQGLAYHEFGLRLPLAQLGAFAPDIHGESALSEREKFAQYLREVCRFGTAARLNDIEQFA